MKVDRGRRHDIPRQEQDNYFEGTLFTSISSITHEHKHLQLQLLSCVCCFLKFLELAYIWTYLAICRCFLLSTTRVTSSSPIRRILRMANTEITTTLGFISVTVHTNKDSSLFNSEALTVWGFFSPPECWQCYFAALISFSLECYREKNLPLEIKGGFD